MITNINNGINFNNPMLNPPQHDKHDKKDELGANLSKPDFEKKAKSLGVPDHIISQGRKAVKEWIMENKQDPDKAVEAKEQSEIEKKAEAEKNSDYKVSIYV